jgi:hypothetical protein
MNTLLDLTIHYNGYIMKMQELSLAKRSNAARPEQSRSKASPS